MMLFEKFNRIKTSVPIRRMYAQYGEKPGYHCRDCCNCQKKAADNETMICLVYSKIERWNKNFHACDEMYNNPFYAYRNPSLPHLEDAYKKYDRRENEDASDQLSITEIPEGEDGE